MCMPVLGYLQLDEAIFHNREGVSMTGQPMFVASRSSLVRLMMGLGFIYRV